MTKVFNTFATTLPVSEGDVCTITNKGITLLIQAVNSINASISCNLWVTNASNVHYMCLFPTQTITAYNGISDTAKHIIPAGYKVRGTADTSDSVYVEVSVLEGL